MTVHDRHSSQSIFVGRHLALAAERVPDADAVHLARLVADTFAVAHYARTHAIGAAGKVDGRAGPVPVWGGRGAPDAASAAFLNGLAAEALDYQEVLIDGRNNGHAAVVIVPALLALVASADTRRLLPALRLAFAANVALARALGRRHRADGLGFRTTSMTAPIAAALGGAVLVDGDQRLAMDAVGLAAAALPAGLLAAMAPDAGDYSEDKDISVGLSARHAVEAVELARAGVTAPRDALAGARGWLASYGMGDARPEALEADPREVDLSAYAIKIYPANFGCQCAIRLAIEASREVGTDRVAKVLCRVKSSSAASLSTRALTSHVAARFSLPYAVASALVRGRSTLADFEGEAFSDPEVLAMMDRVALEGDDALEARHRRDGTFPAELRVTMGSGEILSRSLESPWQDLPDEAAHAILAGKLRALLPPERAGALLDALAAGDARAVMDDILASPKMEEEQ